MLTEAHFDILSFDYSGFWLGLEQPLLTMGHGTGRPQRSRVAYSAGQVLFSRHERDCGNLQ